MDHHGKREQERSAHERFVLTTVVKEAQWQADACAVLVDARTTLHQRAAQRGLLITGEPFEDVEVMVGDHRVRITLTAAAAPIASSPPIS
ncbi:hypothetical protein [Kineococcus rubinsiae]|uniref:hypothetical protein n=1 Tax=Kineococcus rubinsiae TaxID=2609562 RepID=UPI001431D9BB|nr:hypothetical protein [Kineococcus rubinsiae]NIZ90387.1 hypothetical protein [Kineococcus rubinsiae]